ncbi:MAG TPA: trypsin-like peptidase domain-containing protein [Candidatus Saccharimonadales bacterium]|nr:trypsin-like peptidase domain-containing protein [Candidatus Saccharimonadales bacterium]
MYVKGRNRGGHTPLPIHPKKHHKPYRIRHIGLFISGVLAVIFSAFAVGYLMGQSGITNVPASPEDKKPVITVPDKVRSDLGFSFVYDPALFSAEGTAENGQEVTSQGLKERHDLSEVRLMPRNSTVVGSEALSGLSISMETDSSALDSYKSYNGYSSLDEALIGYYAPKSSDNFTVSEAGRSRQIVGNLRLEKIVYKKTPAFSSDAKPVFLAMWVGISHGRPVRISLDNFLSKDIPSIYGPVLDSVRFDGTAKNGVLSDSTEREPFDVNKVSPAVVKIYHFVCGTLVINGASYGQDACDGDTGSGFLISADGYIATNGHVVVMDAADILVNELLSDPTLLDRFTSGAGLSVEQSQQSDVVASLLAKLYDLPPQKLRLDNRREVTFAALGNRPLGIGTQADVKKLFGASDSGSIKKADIVSVNYSPKDLLVIEQGKQSGFSASDVALLKVNVRDAPFIGLGDSASVTQSAPISLLGFPADADNQLTDNNIIQPSSTDGTISSIRRAHGSSSLLFQTDADASEGSSGGPAIDQKGKAFGLVTYRFKSNNEADSAKSYIRDIADLKEVIDSKDIALNTDSATQAHWEMGLDLFNSDRFSKAIIDFRKVQKLYPAHRLVNDYIARAQQAISEGRDKKDPPWAVITAIVIGIGGAAAAAAAAVLMINHRKAHLAYKEANLAARIPPAN